MKHIKALRIALISLAALITLFGSATIIVRAVDRADANPEKVFTRYFSPEGLPFYRISAGPANAWLIGLDDASGYLMIDTGYPEDYERFCEGLDYVGIAMEEIRYLFITHAHDEHAGFAARLKRDSACTLILPYQSIGDLSLGRFDWQGYSVNPQIHILGSLYDIIKRRDYSFEAVLPAQDDIILDEGNTDIGRTIGIRGTFIHTPGHSADSWSLVMDDGRAFVGDAAMNMLNAFGAGYRPIFMEDRRQVYESLNVLRDSGVEFLYTGHGEAFSVNHLPVYLEEADKGPGLAVLPVFSLRLLPGFLLGFILLYFLRGAGRMWRVWIYILLFVLMRDLMTPFALWSFGSHPVFWLRFAADGALLLVLALSSLALSVSIYFFERKRGPALVWFKGSALPAVLAGLGAAILVAGPLLLMRLGIDVGERGGFFPAHYIPALVLFSLSGNLLEELLFRGYLQTELEFFKINPRMAAILSGLLFAFCHLFLAYTVTDAGLPLVLFTLWEGIICGLLMKRFGLLSAVLTHGLAIALIAIG